MDRALFNSASYGTISFHHRNHVEYLAASWVERLMANNCGRDALEDLLFAIVDGQHVLRPSLAPVAAWLVKEKDEPWRQPLLQLLQKAAPEIHLVHGDPASLPHDYRRNILRSLVERYKGRKFARLNWNHEALTRLADPALAEDIQNYLSDENNAEDLRADLLMIVRAGKLSACMTNVLEFFAKPSTSDRLRGYAATVVRDIGTPQDLKTLAELWPTLQDISNSLLGVLCEALYPRIVDAEGLVTLLRRSKEVKRFSVDLPHILKVHLEKEMDHSLAEELLPRMIDLLHEEPLLAKPKVSRRYIWIKILLPIFLRKLLAQSNPCQYIYDSAAAAIILLEEIERHGAAKISRIDNEEIEHLKKIIAPHHELRRLLFWSCVKKHHHTNSNERYLFYHCIFSKKNNSTVWR